MAYQNVTKIPKLTKKSFDSMHNYSAKLVFLYLILSLLLLAIIASLLLTISRLKKPINFNTFKILKHKLALIFEKLILVFDLLNDLEKIFKSKLYNCKWRYYLSMK